MLWDWLTEPSAILTTSTDRRTARLSASLLLAAVTMLIISRLVRTVIAVPESDFNKLTFNINTLVLIICYSLARTRYYRVGTILGITIVLFILYLQTIYRAANDPVHLTDSTVWSAGIVLIGGIIISWRIMVGLVILYGVGLGLLPLFVPGLTFYDVRFSLEFTIGMSALITAAAALRSRDIRRIEEQSAQLVTSESRYRTLLEAGFEAIIIHDNGIILDVNDTVIQLTGYTMPELIGKMTIELVAPDAQAVIAKYYEQRSLETLVYESVLQHKDGHRIDIELRSRAIVYQDEWVRVIAMRDITESKQSREQLKNLYDNLDRVFFSFSAIDIRVLQISPACEKMYGYPPQSFYDDPSIWFTLTHPDDVDGFTNDLLQIANGRRELAPFRIIRKDGEIRWIELLMMPAHDSAGNIVRIDGLATDVTERREIEVQQRELRSERERSLVLRQFITDASHDLRTPLATMYTSLYLLRRISPADEKISRYLDTLETQTTHLSRVLDDLFTMSRLDAPETYIEKYRVDVNQIMENIINGRKEKAAEKQIQLHYVPADAPLWVMADKDYLLVALGHVVTNALQYTPSGGSVTIRNCNLPTKQACVEVEDTGMGIHAAEIPYIFDRFYRSDKARKTDQGGVGLGLSLARKIVEIHDGTILADSTPGKGTTFRIALPLVLQ